ncbi:Stk1 family PASTA domain-containing Ser/Thr kinase [Mobilicoccus caccae]|uniref:Stk1 family PASTA domain-containing Ser/Thr kinase n=1 Tax=Mobilicoccus caccae TaxID=1859295 RepID=UPI0024E0B311|nr:Stk1 family PASTA domain-containing Ser/Thr kinase [Mobilicoccus caccae]
MATVQQDGLVGRMVDGRYTVLAHIADGGMGSVYAALDTRLDRQVALKVMRPELARDADFVTRFRREARSAARLSHPHVVAVFDQGEDDGLLFLAMEFVDGQTLRDLLNEKDALTPREAFEVTEAVLEALRAAHRKDLVHRDVKPENVLLSTDDQVKVADFGLARAMGTSTATGRTGPLLGTVAYLAPEQVEHGTADHRSDLYGVGLLLHEMLTGRTAVEGESPIHIAWQHVNGSLTPPSGHVEDLPGALDDLVATATRRDPADRYQDAAAFLAALRTTRLGLSDEDLDRRPQITAPTTPAAGDDDASDTAEGDDRVADDGTGEDADTAGTGEDEAGETSPARAPGTHDTRTLHRMTRALPTLGGATAVTPPEEQAADTPRRRRRGLRAVLIGLLLTLLLAGGGAAYWWFGPPGERTVPDVVATERLSAESMLREADLLPVTEEEFSETVPRDTVISVGAEPGSVVRRGTSIPLAVSKGPERYAVPDVAGRTIEEATALIAEGKLTVSGSPRRAYDEKIESGRVIGTTPAAGTSSRPGTEVTLVVSRGRQPIPIDDIAGQPLEKAQAQLEKAGLAVQVADERAYSTGVPEGAVISTDPAEGPLYKGDTITLTISRGPEMIAVPSVSGMSAREAQDALTAAGFKVEVNRIAGGIFGTAHSTEPARGTAPKGSTITLNVV